MSILIVSGIEGVRNCADAVAKLLARKVEVVEGRRAALDALRRRSFSAVVVDETLAECDPVAADAIWDHSGAAIPLQINFALSGAARIVREIRAALNRREREQAVALLAAREDIGTELRKTVTGLLLQSELALSHIGVPTVVEMRKWLQRFCCSVFRKHCCRVDSSSRRIHLPPRARNGYTNCGTPLRRIHKFLMRFNGQPVSAMCGGYYIYIDQAKQVLCFD